MMHVASHTGPNEYPNHKWGVGPKISPFYPTFVACFCWELATL
jgi:hypothetical protein